MTKLEINGNSESERFRNLIEFLHTFFESSNIEDVEPAFIEEYPESESFSRIDTFCRKLGERISGVYLYERKGEVLYIGKGKPIFNRIKSHYIESYREVGGDTQDKKWHRFFSKYNGPVTAYISEIEREADRKIVEMVLQESHETVFSKFKSNE